MSKFKFIFTILSINRYIIVIVLAVVFLGFVGENSWLAHLQHESTIKDLKREIARYKKQYREDSEHLEQLGNSLEAIRRVARERYFMKAENEDIFVIEEEED